MTLDDLTVGAAEHGCILVTTEAARQFADELRKMAKVLAVTRSQIEVLAVAFEQGLRAAGEAAGEGCHGYRAGEPNERASDG